ncbi:YlcI/YnfO family protein [Propionivibrio sp.]|uniref:YlcI/YnfO family protein n=1 Tax=Propionivibrio sp. TaxID=2212460 RepID=UPI003BF1C1B1
MKTATIPSLGVAPELRQAAESVLQDGETLSSFVESSLRTNIKRRRFQQEFIARREAELFSRPETPINRRSLNGLPWKPHEY